MDTPTLARVNEIWTKVKNNRRGYQALLRLKKAGFSIVHMEPRDPTFRQPCWADYIAALPFLPNRPSHTQLHSQKALRRHLPLVRALRRYANKLDDPFCEKHRVTGPQGAVDDRDHKLGNELRRAAELVEKFLHWDWYLRDKNPRNAAIAELRYTVRSRTGNPHDREIAILIDAAFRAAGVRDGLHLGPTTLDRIEKREKEARVKATCRLNYLSGISPTPKIPKLAYSTRFPRNRGKRV